MIIFAVVSAAFAWNQTEFMIFTFFDPCLSSNTDTANAMEVRWARLRFLKAKEAYFNLLTGVQEARYGVQTQEGMDYALFIASAVPGLKYLAVDKRIQNGEAAPAFRPCLRDTAAAVTDHYGKFLATRFPSRRNVLFGYNLGDEPRVADAQNVKNWIAHIKRSDESKLAYVNLLPSYGFKNRAEYEAYVDTFINDPVAMNRPDVVSFDHYPLFGNGAVRQDYFYNLRIIGTKAGARPFWVYIQSVDHLNYVDPSAEHLRFMVFCPIAYGARGLGYFTYGQPDDADYRDALVNACEVQTPKYGIARTINRYIHDILGPVVMQARWKGAYHASNKPTGEADELLVAARAPCISAVGNDSCLVGMFQSKTDTATYYCLLVNKALVSVHKVTVAFNGDYTGRVSRAPTVVDYSGDTSYRAVYLTMKGTVMTVPELRGGEGQLFRITGVIKP